VTFIRDRAGGRFDGRPPDFLPHRTLDRRADEPAPASRTGDPVDLSDQVVVELDVHSHV